jgi:signal peptidase II
VAPDDDRAETSGSLPATSEPSDRDELDLPDAVTASPWRAPLLLAAGVVIADQLTKHWAVNRLTDDRVIELFWTLQFNLAFNSGMAFSRGQGLGPIIAVVATVVIVWLLVSLRTTGGRLNTFGIGCVIGGAAGNLIDRAFRQDAWLRGAVVDFIDFQWFPIFNVADIAINVGAGALILNAILTARGARSAAAQGGVA